MHTRTLGNSDMQITPIGFGAWAIGGPWAYGWGNQEDSESIAAIRRAVERGINWIDTAAVYGLGHSEEVVAKALEGVSPRPWVFTKCSLVWDDKGAVSNALKADSIRREVEDSLRRLRVEVIDLYQIHWPNPDPDIEEGWTALAELKREGKVRHIGVSNFSVGQMRRAQAIAPITSLQPPYSLLNRGIEAQILPFCQANDIGVIVYSPMASGLLTGAMTRERIHRLAQDDWRRNNPEFQEPRLSRNLKLVERLRQVGQRHGRAPGEVAIAWTLRQPAVTGAIVGARRPDQVEGFVAAAEFRLSEADIAEIEAGL
ncbi:MAG: aldo/keto reductase [Pseudomonadota bacterium]|nr:aldo/keto reductase [Pseudomonadota bacterium]